MFLKHTYIMWEFISLNSVHGFLVSIQILVSVQMAVGPHIQNPKGEGKINRRKRGCSILDEKREMHEFLSLCWSSREMKKRTETSIRP